MKQQLDTCLMPTPASTICSDLL